MYLLLRFPISLHAIKHVPLKSGILLEKSTNLKPQFNFDKNRSNLQNEKAFRSLYTTPACKVLRDVSVR